MKVGFGLYIVGAGILLALVGCGRGFLSGERAPWRHDAEVACMKSGSIKIGASVVRVDPIEGPGMCGADFPLKVAAVGESSSLVGYADDLRPPGSIPNGSRQMPRWPINEPQYAPPAPVPSVQSAPAQAPRMRWVPGPPPAENPGYGAPAGQPVSLSAPSVAPAATRTVPQNTLPLPNDIPDDAELPRDRAHHRLTHRVLTAPRHIRRHNVLTRRPPINRSSALMRRRSISRLSAACRRSVPHAGRPSPRSYPRHSRHPRHWRVRSSRRSIAGSAMAYSLQQCVGLVSRSRRSSRSPPIRVAAWWAPEVPAFPSTHSAMRSISPLSPFRRPSRYRTGRMAWDARRAGVPARRPSCSLQSFFNGARARLQRCSLQSYPRRSDAPRQR